MKHTDNSQYILKSVDKALGIIDLFASQKELGSNEIDRLTGARNKTCLFTFCPAHTALMEEVAGKSAP